MKSFPLNGFRMVAAVAATLFIPMGLSAGEAIVSSNAKTHAYPSLKPNLPGDSKGLKFGVATPMDGITPGMYNSRRRDRRAERQAQNAEDEKRNWMVLDPGQLNAEDEQKSAFGVKEYDLEKPNSKRDYFFAPPEDKGDRTGRPQQLGRPGGKNKNSSEAKETTREPEQGATDNAKGDDSQKQGRQVGDHVSKDLDLKDLLAPGKANSLAPAEDKTAKMWKDVLGNGATAQSRDDTGQRNDGSVADGFRPSAADSSIGTRSQAPTPSFGLRNDYAAPPPAANSPSLSGPASSGFTAPSTPMVPRGADRYFGGASAPPSASRVPTPDNYSRPNANGFGSSSANSPYNQPPPPRRPSSTFDIPARPR